MLTPLMKVQRLFALLAIAFIFGCSKSGGGGQSAVATNAPAAVTNPGEPTQAQAKLPTVKLWLGPEEINSEVAVSPRQLGTGMMFRTNVSESDSMIFILPSNQRASFWMKNCPTALSVAYIDPDGVILEIHDLEPFNTNSVVAASDNIRFALEVPQGWFNRHHIRE